MMFIYYGIIFGLLLVSSAEEINQSYIFGGKIYNGSNAVLGQFKYQALLDIRLNHTHKASCGGAIISEYFVLTAAHCCYRVKKINIYMGLLNSHTKEGAVRREAVDITVHHSYDPYELVNDICILKVKQPIEMDAHVGKIALPSYNKAKSTTYDDVLAIASGWGQTSIYEPGIHSTLQWAIMHVATRNYCKEQLKSFTFTEGQICTDKSIYSAPCPGDSGGPLAYYKSEDKEPLLIGLVSWGVGSCANPFPDVFTYTGFHLEYIHRVTDLSVDEQQDRRSKGPRLPRTSKAPPVPTRT